ncbi:B12-binding domain-containing radical SAM protein [Candidatus Omnitrophota bacterium]
MNQQKDYDVVLFYPKTGIDLGATIAPPHGLLTVAAPLLKAGYRVRLIDQRVIADWQEDLREALQVKPICVGFSAMTGTQIQFALEAAKLTREILGADVPLVWGGPHPSGMAAQTLENMFVDIVVVGEGDITFIELVDALKAEKNLRDIKGIGYIESNQVVLTEERELLDMETLLPVPWELIDVEKYIHRDFYLHGTTRSLDIGQTSRGCPYQCGFCSSATLRKRKWRAMSVEKSLKVILDPVKRFNLDGIWIRDDEFYIDRKRTKEICKGIIDSGVKIRWYTSGTRIDVFNRSTTEEIELIKKSGADTLKFGAESGSNRILKLIKKGIRVEDTIKANLKAKEYGIIPVFALMIGFPTETFEDINQTIDLFVRLKKDNPLAKFEVIATFGAMPQTPLYPLALEHGLNPPKNLEGWISWLFDEYDLKGDKLAWFNKRERMYIGNITYMSIFANASLNAINGISNVFIRNLFKGVFIPFSWFERFKLKRKWYHFSPELDLVRFLRKKIFYQSKKSIL